MSISNKNLKIYNSLSQKKEDFKTLNPSKVGIYVCGPTVYNKVHLGNCRTFISFDLIVRFLKHIGYDVRYVRNITDVGHLEESEEEDKILKRAKIEKLEPMEVVQKYTNNFREVLNKFNLLSPNIEPTATGHIIEQIEMIEMIIDNGYAYEKNGSVYFDLMNFTKKYKYGKLSNRNLDDIINESRELFGSDEKKNLQDFALWKKATSSHIMKWKSPWGYGFPGWHIECSAMSHKYLGKKFDIHGGGMDLKFPHHDCEIAQSEAAYNQNPANYWVHTNMLTLNGRKMSKSTENFILPENLFSGDSDIIEKGYNPMVVKFLMYQAHYRNTLDLSNESLLASEKGYNKLMQSFSDIDILKPSEKGSDKYKLIVDKCYNSMLDDFNSPKLISHLFELSKLIEDIKKEKEFISKKDIDNLRSYMKVFLIDILGFSTHKNIEREVVNKDKLIDALIDIRDFSRKIKSYEISDIIREKLNSLGINIEDK
ncbi:cysteine--tRNA ligase [Flavobacteriales bacterium]|nr:cysteine--tRNA ligase [Flavobacteriales bacterium]